MNRTTCPNKMVDTCCENYDDCTLSFYDKDAEIKRLNEKIEFLARTNILYSDWEHRSHLIRKGIEEHKINAELRAEIERLKQPTWVGLTDEEILAVNMSTVTKLIDEPIVCDTDHNIIQLGKAIETKLKQKNTRGQE